MSSQKLISFELKADFGFLKKPDYNDGLLLSYNMLHKPALLGILGAVLGLDGYKQKGVLPDYYLKLSDLPVGIEPLEHEKGNFQKTSVKYTNTVGYANRDGNLLVEETILIKPAYRCYLLLDLEVGLHQLLLQYLRDRESEYIPYIGKNEYQAWFGDDLIEYDFYEFQPIAPFKINSLFLKEGVLNRQRIKATLSFDTGSMTSFGSFSYFERLPIAINEQLMQYELGDFAFTDWTFNKESSITNLYLLKDKNSERIIQLF